MTNPLEAMLARWPVLYPEITSDGEGDYDLTSASLQVRGEVIAPLLMATDIHRVLGEKREAYMRWRDSLPGTELALQAVLDQEDQLSHALSATFDAYSEELGEQPVKAALEGIRLRRIVRRSVFPYRETWPEESWERIGHLMTKSELCHAGMLEYLSTEEGSSSNVEELAKWAFQYALEAYWDAGRHGQNSTKLEDIPE